MRKQDREDRIARIHVRLAEIDSAMQNLAQRKQHAEQSLWALGTADSSIKAEKERRGWRNSMEWLHQLTLNLVEERSELTERLEKLQLKASRIKRSVSLIEAHRRVAISNVDIGLALESDVNYRDEDGQTALMYAAAKGYSYIVEFLLSVGANVEIEDNSGNSAASLAEENGNFDICQILRSHVCPFGAAPPTHSFKHHIASDD